MIKLLKYIEKDKLYNLIKLTGFSFVIHKPSIGQKNVQVYLSKSLLVFIIEGKKIVHTDTGDIIINPGEAFFAQKGAYLLSDKLNQTGKFQSLIFFIDDKFLKEFINKNMHLISKTNIGDWNKPEIYKINSSQLLKSYIKSLLPYFSQNISNKMELLQLKFEELFFHLINTDKNHQFLRFLKSMQLSAKIDIVNFMNKNFTLPLTVQEFAKHTSRSLTSFKNEFKNIYNQPPKKWINEQRLERAHTLLAITDKNVTEICFDVGFDNVSHFIQLFKKHYGLTPKKLKSQLIKSNSK